MADILVVIEHRSGSVRESSLQLFSKARELAQALSGKVLAVILAPDAPPFLKDVASLSDRVFSYQDDRFAHFNGTLYARVIQDVIDEQNPAITLMAHSPWGMDLAPALAVKTSLPLATDCVDVMVEGERIQALRQVYGGKLFSRVTFREAPGVLVTIRPGSFPVEQAKGGQGECLTRPAPPDLPESGFTHVGFEDAGAGAVDIAQADLLVSIGRGVGEAERIGEIQELADLLGGVLSCSRPVVDKGWLPKYHQVGTSGKSVKPKVYVALGISGAFQHVAGIAGAGAVIAVNKDRKAPIFRAADYGVAADLFDVVEALKKRLK